MKFIKKTKSILYGMEFTHGLRRALMSSLALLYFLSFGFSVISVTTLFAISTIILTVFEFPTGAIADYDSRKRSLMTCFFLMSLAFFGLFIFRNFWLLAFSWILGDIAWTFYSGSGSAWAIDALKIAKEKSKIVSLISRGYLFEKSGWIIGGLIGLIVVAINFRFVWLFVAFSNLFMLLIVARYMEERNFKPEKTSHNYLGKTLFKAKESFIYLIHEKNKELRVLLIASIFGIMAVNSFFVGLPLALTKIIGLDTKFVSGIYSLMAAFGVLSSIAAGKLNYEKGFRKILSMLAIFIGISIIIFALSKSLIVAMISLAILNLASSASDVVQDSALHHVYSSKIRASLGSMSSVIWTITSSIVVFLTGISITFLGLTNTMIISGIFGFLTAFSYLYGLGRGR